MHVHDQTESTRRTPATATAVQLVTFVVDPQKPEIQLAQSSPDGIAAVGGI